MQVHREGYASIFLSFIFSSILIFIAYYFFNGYSIAAYTAYSIGAFSIIVMLQFFRSPTRNWTRDQSKVICPADGKVVVIEEVMETEYFHEKRIQVSIFMSPVNVHINRYPVSGRVLYTKHHPGKYLVAWHPKSSLENERTTIVVEQSGGKKIMLRQIAGALARRIRLYAKEGNNFIQGEEFGFIKFGSRVDIFLPLDAKIEVVLNQKVKGGVTAIAGI